MEHHDEGARAGPEDVPELCGSPGHHLTRLCLQDGKLSLERDARLETVRA